LNHDRLQGADPKVSAASYYLTGALKRARWLAGLKSSDIHIMRDARAGVNRKKKENKLVSENEEISIGER